MAESKVSGSTVGTYTYDSQNRRAKKVAGGNATQYIYGLDGLLYGEYTSAGALIREYVYLADAPLAQVDAGTPEVLTYLHTDHLGTPRFGANTGGTQVWAWTSDAFGNGAPSGAATVNLRMPGQYFDTESDLFYNWNRYYNPAIGRYVSSDPIGIDGGLNTFLYTGANPVMYADPEGLFLPLLAPVVIQGGAIAVTAAGTCARNPRCVGLVIKGTKELAKQISKSKAHPAVPAVGAVATGEFCPPESENPKKPDCKKASNWDLEQAGITDAHAYKEAHKARPHSKFDICKCKDGTIRIADQGMCGKTNNFWD